MADETANHGTIEANNGPHDAPRGLVCGACGHVRLKVVYTRHAPGGRIVRRRECRRCGKRITTWERMIGEVQMRNDSTTDAIGSISSRCATAPK